MSIDPETKQMRRWLQLILLLLAGSAFAYAPAPRAVLTAHDVGVVRPVVSDTRGNVHGIFDTVEGEMNWNGSRPTGYGAVPEHRPLALSDNGDLGSASAWRGRWPDRSGLYWLGARYYDPVAGRFISCDPYGHDADPSLYAFADGDPINRFDPDGRVGKATASWAGGMATGLAGLVNNTLGALGYSLASPFAPDWAYQNLGGYAEGFGNTVMGLGQTVYDVGAFGSYALTSPFNNEFAYNNYGGSMERLGGVADALRGGSDQSLAYQITYGTLNAGTLILGGELGQLGRVGRVGRVGEAAGASTQVARVGEYANWGGEFSYLDEVGFGAVRPNATRTATQLEFDFVNNLPPKPPINWPDNWGFAGNPSPATLVPGTLVDRWGLASGNFVSPEGTPFIQRSLAPGTQYAPYNVYQVLQPIDVNAGQIAPAFGMPGNGMQFQLPSSVQSLIDSGHLGTQ